MLYASQQKGVKTAMSKVDLKKEFKHLYNSSSQEPDIVDVPVMNFLMADGAGNPNTVKDFTVAIEALYSLSYTLKFRVKKGEAAADYTVMPLEGLWWTDNMAEFSMKNKDIWKWTLLIRQPEQITGDLVAEAVEQVAKKKNLPALARVRLESFHEGLAAQIIHIGPYSAEGPTVEKLHRFIIANGYALTEKHHEIYLNDPRKVAPEKVKTILRQPVRKK